MVGLWLLACGDELICGEGTHEYAGVCVAGELDGDTAPAAFEIRGLPDCGSDSGDGSVDLLGACAEGFCYGDPYADVLAALGPPSDCSPWCEWPSGVGFEFDPMDDPPDDDATISEVWLKSPYPERTSDGLGVDVSLACFFDVLGPASGVDLMGEGDTYYVRSASWDEPDVYAFDDDALGGDADGIVDTLTFEPP